MSKLNYTQQTLETSISRANKKAEQTGKEIYVIHKEGSGYSVADVDDFQEFFMMKNYQIVYSTNQSSEQEDEELRLALIEMEEDLKCM